MKQGVGIDVTNIAKSKAPPSYRIKASEVKELKIKFSNAFFYIAIIYFNFSN